jgi:hypothetical protein
MIASSERAIRELGWKRRCSTAQEVMQRYACEVPRRIEPRIEVFLRLMDQIGRRLPRAAAAPDPQQLDLRLHLNISGERGGDFALRLERGRLQVRHGVPRPLDAVLTLSDVTLLEILSGKLDLSTAQLTGRVHLAGEPAGGWVLASLVTGFRLATERGGLRGWSMRRLSDWFSGGLPA